MGFPTCSAKLFYICILHSSLKFSEAFSFFHPSLHQRGIPAALFQNDASTSRRFTRFHAEVVDAASGDDSFNQMSENDGADSEALSNEPQVVRAPLRFLGPYIALALRFPDLATSSQRERNMTGVSLDFVLDTAANTNTLNAQVAQELELERVGEAPPGVGPGGNILGGDTFLLGDCQLDGLPKEEKFTFMAGLTASALPVASPAAAGLLSLAFFYCFSGGVEFEWQDTTTAQRDENGDDEPRTFVPSVSFHESEDHLSYEGLKKISFESQPMTNLPCVTLCINGVEVPALFDTGSPITVLNAQASELAGIKTTVEMSSVENKDVKGKGFPNPFSKLAEDFKTAQETAQATARGDIVAIAGSDGKPIQLLKSRSKVLVETKDGGVFGESHVYVGDLPGLAALGGLGGGASPAAVLGMDVIRLRPRLIFRAQQNEIYI